MFLVSFWMGQAARRELCAVCDAFLYRSRHTFELAIAVAVFGLNSGEAFVGVVGPLIEVPALIGLVNSLSEIRTKYFSDERRLFAITNSRMK
jgi:ACR3 family arsenite transporter